MKLSISNIGWQAKDDLTVYDLMKKYGYSGLEIAPTRIFPDKPYEKLKEAEEWAQNLKIEYGFLVSSMQSIWFGRQENLFRPEERQVLIHYTKKAIDFAAAIGCKNLVFGCPRNRNLPEGEVANSAVSFFKEIGDYAADHGTVIGMEANPPIYHTNYVNSTMDALELIQEVGSDGFRLNLDVGTMIQNGESIEEVKSNVHWINHVHISEPGLKIIENRELHVNLKKILEQEDYQGFVSIEMGTMDTLDKVEMAMQYVKTIF